MTFSALQQLQCEFSDFYKDCFGYRPKHLSTENWNSADFLWSEINAIRDYMIQLNSNPEGRAMLVADGWTLI